MFLFNYSGKAWSDGLVLTKKRFDQRSLQYLGPAGQVALQISLFPQLLNKKLSWCRRSLKGNGVFRCVGKKVLAFRWISPHRNKIQSGSWSTSGTFDLVNSLSLSTKRVCQTILLRTILMVHSNRSTLSLAMSMTVAAAGKQSLDALWWNGGQTE